MCTASPLPSPPRRGEGAEPKQEARFRKLRIAWSVGWGLLAVLLCVFWVRSYSRTETVHGTNKNLLSTTFGSTAGLFYFHRTDESGAPSDPGDPFSVEPSAWHYSSVSESPPRPLKFEWKSDAKRLIVRVPYRYLTPICAAIALIPIAPWLPYRFSLRTLLVATTLVAVALGLIVWASR
jgi:hypothetical protein